MSEDCIFCKIVAKEASSEIIYENEKVMVFRNIRPSAPVHLLAIPKKHIASINQIVSDDRELIGEVIIAAKEAARKEGIDESGYKLAVNVGKGGGQEIFHLHVHLLGGWKRVEERDIPGMP